MTDNEREMSQQLFGGQEPKSMGAMEAVKEAFKDVRDALAPGLTWDKISSEVGQELKHLGNLGRDELANALFGQGPFVLYSHEPENKQSMDGPEQAQDIQPIQQDHGQHLERGGRSM